MPRDPEQDADDEEVMGKIAELAKAVPTLRPRMIRLVDEHGTSQRFNIGRIVRWHPASEGEADHHGILVIQFDGGYPVRLADPEGKLDEALCSAFFDVTPADLY